MKKNIEIRGAREHNLKGINIDLPLNRFIVVSGVSGSGKSSLAFDTVYAEGQRRYVESLSAYARQFLGQMKKPRVDSISGIPPAVAIQQKGPGYNPRSTVGTLTEINDYLRLLFARVGIPHCTSCGRRIQAQSVTQVVSRIIDAGMGRKITINSPVVRGRKGAFRELMDRLRGEGFVNLEINGRVYSLEEEINLDPKKRYDISVMIDRIEVTGSQENAERINDSVELALKRSGGVIEVSGLGKKTEVFSIHYSCPVCGISIGEMEPRTFSFNSPYGACPECSGLGLRLEVDESLVIPDDSLSLSRGAVRPWAEPVTGRRKRWETAARKYRTQMVQTLAGEMGFSLDTEFRKLPLKVRKALLYGTRKEFDFVLTRSGRTYKKRARFEGAVEELRRRHLQTDSDYVREKIQKEYMREKTCHGCGGARLRPESLAVTVGKKNIAELSLMGAAELREFLEAVSFSEYEETVSVRIIRELKARLGFLIDVGVDYISLDRSASSLSSGEAERIRLATQIGSSLVGVAYILDEPTVGLHARDTARLIGSLKRLQELGNTLVVVEHDSATLDAADYVVDLGPEAGSSGGSVVYAGTRGGFRRDKKSLTSGYYTGRMNVPAPEKPRKPGPGKIVIEGCSQYNLKNIRAEFPLGVLICVTGVSGSGKSTLVEEILYKSLVSMINPRSDIRPGAHRKISGYSKVKRVINIDQTPIGRTPRSNPATYTGLLTPVREIFASLPESRARGYRPGRFSFNVKEGTCRRCRGQGEIKLEMHFLPDIYVPCESCGGKKFTEATLQVKFKGKNIYEVLEMTVDTASEFFSGIPSIKRILETLQKVGLGYIKLGQASTTLSGGEAQRIKLARELSKKTSSDTLYILDEPTTGLHPHDIKHLLSVLHSLVDRGSTVVVIEHNMDVIKNADWIIDLGPEGGDKGGEILVCGNPTKLIKYPESYTGEYLKKYIKPER